MQLAKNNLLMQQLLYVVAITVVVIFSFFSFSEAYYPLLNSDSALNVLMTHTYSLPQDLYCWGQDRGGTLIPLIGHILMKLTGMSAVYTCSFSHYFILIVCFVFLAMMFRSKLVRLLLAVIWFLPPSHMVDFVLYPFSTQFSLLAIMMFFTNKIFVTESGLKKPLLVLYAIIITVASIISVWVSDLSVLSIFILLVFILYKYYSTHEGSFVSKTKAITGTFEFSISTLLSIIGIIFIIYAKSHAAKTSFYNENIINNFSNVWSSIKMSLISIIDMLCFRSKEMMMGVYVYAVIVASVVLLFVHKRSKEVKTDKVRNYWTLFFLINAALSLLIILFSHWVFLNGVNRRYFTVVYLSLWLAFLFYADNVSLFKNKINSIVIMLVMLASIVSGVFSFYYPQRMKPAVELATEFKALGKIGIIAEYWNSYINACPDPDNIKATPNDKDTYRNEKMIDEVFDQPAIYVIKDMWMNTFPDTLEQFGYTLKKKGTQFFIGGCYTCQYEKAKTYKVYYLADLKTNRGKIITDTASGMQLLLADSIDRDNNSSLEFGPFIHLGKGKYKVLFHLKVENTSRNDTLAILDVSNDWGKEILAKRYLLASDFIDAGNFEDIELSFEADKRLTSTEFRITYTGKRKLWFDYMELVEL
jgi:hypothetical protein